MMWKSRIRKSRAPRPRKHHQPRIRIPGELAASCESPPRLPEMADLLNRTRTVLYHAGQRLTWHLGRWDNPTMIVTLDSKRRLTVPASLAPASPGEYFDASFDSEEDAIIFRRLAGKEDWLTVLKECPVRMDDVPARRRQKARHRKL